MPSDDDNSMIQGPGGRTRRGVSYSLEDQADRILANSRKDVKKHSLKKDVLSPSQLARRRSREVYPTQGFPEKAIVQGVFGRKYSPPRRKGPRGTTGGSTSE